MAQSINTGTEYEILNVVVNDTTDTKVVFPKKFNNLCIRNRNTDDIYIRKTDGATEYFTIPEGMALTLDMQAKSIDVLYLRSETGTPTVEILVTYE